jgi:hypothetical protein
MTTAFDWQKFVIDNNHKLNVSNNFWQFWRYYFCGNDEERENWKRNDPNFDKNWKDVKKIAKVKDKKDK